MTDDKKTMPKLSVAGGEKGINMKNDKEKFLEFLKSPGNKRYLMQYLTDSYTKLEREEIDRAISRQKYEHDSQLEGATAWHKPGHIGSLMYEHLNMSGVENAYSSSLQHTKASITKTVQQRVNEINTLLRGVGGFNRQIKSSFSRSAVLYLEQDDPKYDHRDRVVFTINIADFELRNPVNDSARENLTDDGRTLQRVSWDDAVNMLSGIISNTGLKPKYVKNDKNSNRLIMKQELLPKTAKQPDEYFEFKLQYVSEEIKEEIKNEYENKLCQYGDKIEELKREKRKKFIGASSRKLIDEEIEIIESDKELFEATTPNPDEMDTGLVFSIYVNSMKDYGVTKDKMQYIMTKFILAASNVAIDRPMDKQLDQGGPDSNLADPIEEGKIAVMKVEKKAS